jgi:hypothetical protein
VDRRARHIFVIADGGVGWRRAVLALLAVMLLGGACRSQDQILAEHEKQLTSLRATAIALGESWLSRTTPSAYTRTALQRTNQLLSADRARLAETPELLATSKGARVAELEDRLSREVAAVWSAVDRGDRAAAERSVRNMSSVASSQP